MTNLYLKSAPYLRSLLAAGALGLLAGPGQALTADELWGQWREYLGSYGYEVSAQIASSGDTLTISDLAVKLDMKAFDAGAGAVTISLGQITLAGQSNGTVILTLPPVTPLVVDVAAEGEPPVKVTMDYAQQGFSMIASGDKEATHNEFSADSLKVALKSIQQDRVSLDLGVIELVLAGLNGTSDISSGAIYTIEQVLEADRLSYVVDIHNPEPGSDGTFKMSGEMRGLTSNGGGAIPKDVDMTDMAAALKAGYAAFAELDYQGGTSDIAFREHGKWFELKTSSEGGSFDFDIDAETLSYGIFSQNLALYTAGDDVPFPVNVSAEEVGFGLAMPLAASDDLKDFWAEISATGVNLPNEVWMMGDPGNALPHDPVTVQASLAGTGRLFVDLTDEEQMMKLGQTGGLPGLVETLTLEALTIKGAGAEINASAVLDVDNDAQSPLGPFPNVFGTAELRLMGVRALVEKLAAMGLVPQGPALMINGMVSELGKQETGPDDLSAHVVLGEQGTLTVNDKPIPLK
ncbi:hypothetical protein [Pseudooceanicola sp.]|uniref:DUF2125 domain-containing protein n=1 Tax=Pseudooceanicola sp. TaxID=1914328 RepID=UPI002624D46F|nr:hypothetical protein [Pseudooceanicola sp.]MDF1855164.1 hypothetical protein [Pseudooceanicola sp.]